MAIKPVTKTRVTNEVSEKLKSLILSGEYKPGERMPPIKELAAALQVGQTTVREGLRYLESLGMIRLQHGSGVYVSDSIQFPLIIRPIATSGSLDPKVFADLLSMRQILETGSAWLAATNTTEDDIGRLEAVLRAMESSIDDPEQFSRCNAEFHMCVAEITGNEIIPMLLKAVRDLIVMHQERLNTSSDVRLRSLNYHRIIYQSIASGDSKLARQSMEEHLKDIESELARLTCENNERPS